jgi:hypothetical protein
LVDRLAEFKYGGIPKETFAPILGSQDKPNMLYYYLKKVRLSLDDIPYRGPAARVAERQTDLCFRVDNAYRTFSRGSTGTALSRSVAI